MRIKATQAGHHRLTPAWYQPGGKVAQPYIAEVGAEPCADFAYYHLWCRIGHFIFGMMILFLLLSFSIIDLGHNAKPSLISPALPRMTAYALL